MSPQAVLEMQIAWEVAMGESAEQVVGIPRGGVVVEVPWLNLMFHYDVDP